MLHYLFKSKSRFIILVLATLVFSLANVSYSQVLKFITLFAENKVDVHYQTVIFVVIGWLIISAFLSYWTAFYKAKYQFNMTEDIRNDIFDKAGKVDAADLPKNGVSMLINQVNMLEQDYYMNIMFMMMLVSDFLFAMFFAVRINLLMTIVIIFLALPGVLLPFFTAGILKKLREPVLRKLDAFTAVVSNYFAGIETIRKFQAFPQFSTRFASKNGQFTAARIDEDQTRRIISALSRTFSNLIYLGTWVVGAFLVAQKTISLADLVAFAQLSTYITYPMNQASDTITELVGSNKVAEEVKAFLDRPEYRQKKGALENPIQLHDVSYKVNGRVILSDISLKIDMTHKYVIVGQSGAGKSVLTDLIFGNKKASQGSVTFAGVNVNIISPNTIDQSVGFLNQHVYFFIGTVRDNITVMNNQITDRAIIKTARLLNLDRVINSTTLDARLDPESLPFSGGETRRIGLLRLLLRNYQFLVLDELVSGIDPKSADEIETIVQDLSIGYLYITHRFNAQLFEQATDVIVVKDGHVAQRPFSNEKTREALLGLHLEEA